MSGVFIEDPTMRVVAVHWEDEGGSPGEGSPGELVCYQGTYTWGYRLTDTGSIITNVPTNADGNPWQVRDPSNPFFGGLLNTSGLTIHPNGITFGAPYDWLRFVFMTVATMHVQATWPITNTNAGYEYGLAIVHTSGPRNFNLFPNSAGLPLPTEPFMTFPAGALDWTYDMIGANGPWAPNSGNPASVDWSDPTRFDPDYGGEIWLIVMRRSALVGGGWSRRQTFWVGSELSPESALVGPPDNQSIVYTYGQEFHAFLTNTCPEFAVGHEEPIVIDNTGGGPLPGGPP